MKTDKKVTTKKKVQKASGQDSETLKAKMVTLDPDDTEDEEEESEDEEEETETETDETVDEAAVQPVKAKQSKKGWVQVACVREMDPAPSIGHFKFREFGIQKLTVNEAYEVPQHVAEVLLDRKCVVRITKTH